LLPGTLITLADGSTKPVEAIRAGDEVLSYDEGDGSMKSSRVVKVFRPFAVEEFVVVNEKIRVIPSGELLSRLSSTTSRSS